ncbi:MAG: hypothetical protein ACYSUT_07940 [Planctomycetota bacterium]|jgi:hypothetical protein
MNKTLLIFGILVIVFIVLFSAGTLWRIVCAFLPNPTDDRNISEMDGEGLDDTCENYIGALLEVHPVYGWGWSGNDEEPNPPSKFTIRLNSLWSRDNKRRGGIGIIEDEKHKYNGWTVIFSTRHYGTFNFTDKIGHYNIRITQSELVEKDGFPLPKEFDNSLSGFCEIKAAQ